MMDGLNQQQIQQQAAHLQQLPAAEFAAKYRSKREVYNFLTVDAGVYLPAYGKSSKPSIAIRPPS